MNEEERCGYCAHFIENNEGQYGYILVSYTDDDYESWRGVPKKRKRSVKERLFLCPTCLKEHGV